MASMILVSSMYLGDPYRSRKSMNSQALKSKTVQMMIRESDHFIVAMKPSKPVERREWHIVGFKRENI